MDIQGIRPGATLYADTGPLKLSALFVPPRSSEVYGLVGLIGDVRADGQEVYDAHHRHNRQPLGKLIPLNQVLDNEQPTDLALLFASVRFEPGVADELSQSATAAAVSGDLVRNIMRGNGMRVRKLAHGPKGFITGDITNPRIKNPKHEVRLDRATLVRGKGARPFARAGDRGEPVLSASNALLGFVVGKNETQALVLSAEELVRLLKLEFLTIVRGCSPEIRARRVKA